MYANPNPPPLEGLSTACGAFLCECCPGHGEVIGVVNGEEEYVSTGSPCTCACHEGESPVDAALCYNPSTGETKTLEEALNGD